MTVRPSLTGFPRLRPSTVCGVLARMLRKIRGSAGALYQRGSFEFPCFVCVLTAPPQGPPNPKPQTIGLVVSFDDLWFPQGYKRVFLSKFGTRLYQMAHMCVHVGCANRSQRKTTHVPAFRGAPVFMVELRG